MTKKEELLDLIMKEEAIFEEKFSGGYLQMRKSLILDDFEKLRIASVSNEAQRQEGMSEE